VHGTVFNLVVQPSLTCANPFPRQGQRLCERQPAVGVVQTRGRRLTWTTKITNLLLLLFTLITSFYRAIKLTDKLFHDSISLSSGTSAFAVL
jgi:hypothetical protein